MPPGMQPKTHGWFNPQSLSTCQIQPHSTPPPGESWPNTSSTGAARVASKGAWYWQEEEAHLSSHYCLDICQMDITSNMLGIPVQTYQKRIFEDIFERQVRCQDNSNKMSFIHLRPLASISAWMRSMSWPYHAQPPWVSPTHSWLTPPKIDGLCPPHQRVANATHNFAGGGGRIKPSL